MIMDDNKSIHPNVIERWIHIHQYKATPNLYFKVILNKTITHLARYEKSQLTTLFNYDLN